MYARTLSVRTLSVGQQSHNLLELSFNSNREHGCQMAFLKATFYKSGFIEKWMALRKLK